MKVARLNPPQVSQQAAFPSGDLVGVKVTVMGASLGSQLHWRDGFNFISVAWVLTRVFKY